MPYPLKAGIAATASLATMAYTKYGSGHGDQNGMSSQHRQRPTNSKKDDIHSETVKQMYMWKNWFIIITFYFFIRMHFCKQKPNSTAKITAVPLAYYSMSCFNLAFQYIEFTWFWLKPKYFQYSSNLLVQWNMGCD